MVNKIQKIIEQYKAKDKPFWAVALFKMDNLIDRWTIILSAPWIKDTNKDQEFGLFLDALKADLSREELISIGQIGLLDKETHLIQELLKRRADSTMENEKVNGNTIHEGTIIESNPDLVWQPSNLFNESNQTEE